MPYFLRRIAVSLKGRFVETDMLTVVIRREETLKKGNPRLYSKGATVPGHIRNRSPLMASVGPEDSAQPWLFTVILSHPIHLDHVQNSPVKKPKR